MVAARGGVILSGMRPTGRLHLGNYWGALRNWVELQERHPCYFAVVDWHMLTTGYEDTSRLQENIREMVLDWLAAGLDPKRCVIFKQSGVPEHAELTLLLSMITPLSWLENNPTWKEQLQELAKTKESRLREELAKTAAKGKVLARGLRHEGVVGIEEIPEADQSLRTHGHLGYPVLQAADILLYDAGLVPVGQDQLAHLELARDIARRFNSLYGKGKPVLVEPKPLLTPTPKVPGLDGRKMSKSYGNALDLLESADSLQSKVMSAYTDPGKTRADTPGHPEPCPENPPGCSVFALHKLYSAHWEKRGEQCRQGKIGCVACKKDLLASLERPFGEFRARRERLAADRGLVAGILEEGNRKARAVASETMARARRAMNLQ